MTTPPKPGTQVLVLFPPGCISIEAREPQRGYYRAVVAGGRHFVSSTPKGEAGWWVEMDRIEAVRST